MNSSPEAPAATTTPSPSATVVVRGDGVAAYCCALLLQRAGVNVRLQRPDRPRVPAIMLSDAAVDLIRDVFARPDLLRNLHRINTRVVAWGPEAKPKFLEHSGGVISEPELLAELGQGLPFETLETPAGAPASWEVLASRPLPSGTQEHRFGSRHTSTARVIVRPSFNLHSCWIESLPEGWLFLIPFREGEATREAWLLAVGKGDAASAEARIETLLASSRVIRDEVVSVASVAGQFASAPRILEPLVGVEGNTPWIACGTAAMGFDPICGDGTAHAIREAILAAAVVQAALGGEPLNDVMAHYQSRLTAGFARHLSLCQEFYRTGSGGPWWEAEYAGLTEGLEWCRQQSTKTPEFHFRLSGYELKSV
jgi:2-polyprenyl-6-methoxyphenol hydroxylase-like FAD-dependent oxidoreductase